MVEKNYIVKNETGLHARPASELVQFVNKYKSDIRIIKDGCEYDAKSIIEILCIGAVKGTEIVISVQGEDEAEAMDNIVNFLDNIEE